MEKKLNLPKLWRTCTIIFIALSWIILVFFMDMPAWVIIPVFIVYLIINALVFNSYFLGLLGNFYLVSGKHKKAFETYKKAIDKNTRNVSALYAYGIEILKEESRADEALQLLKRAENLNTKVLMDKNIRLAMSSCYWVKGDIDKAIETLEKLRKEYSYVNTHVYTTLGYFYILKEDFEKALEYSKAALEDNPQHAAAWDNIGQIYYLQNKYDEAKDAFKKALSNKSNMVDSLYYLGLIYESENALEEAADCFKKANDCSISSLNTISYEQVTEKYNQYFS